MSSGQSLSVGAVDAQLASCRQGDVADFGTFSWHADAQLPLTEAAAQTGNDSGHEIVVSRSEEMVVVTQTCDLVRSCADRPFVQLSPVVYLEQQAASEAKRGMRPRYAPIPDLDDLAFGDLDRIVTVEKTLLAGATRKRGCADDRSARRFAASVGRKFGRIAFPDDLVLSLRGLTTRVRAKHDKNSAEGNGLASLEEIRVTASPSWNAETVDVFLSFCPSTTNRAREVMTEEDWDSIIDEWIGRCEPTGKIASVDGAMIPLEELSALEYIDSDRLDLDHLSG